MSSRDNTWQWSGGCALFAALFCGCSAAPLPQSTPAHATFRTAVVKQQPLAISADAQWASWRGGAKHGVSAALRLPTVWSDSQGIRWKVAVPGRGNASPVIWGDDLFLTSVLSTDAGDQSAVLCFDRRSGALRWQQIVGAPQGSSHSKNGFASATPATDGQRVYAAFGSLGLSAFDFDGQLVWHVPLPQQKHPWGTAASPVVFDNLVIHVADGESEAAIVAYEATSGREQWRTPRSSRGSWSSPVLLNAGSADAPSWQVIVNGTGNASGSSGEVIAYDPRTGQEIWKARGTTDIPCPTAIVGERLVISTSGSNGPVFALHPNGSGDVTESHLAWRLPSGGAYVPTGVIYQQRLYLISDAGVATCHRLDEGTTLWRKRLHGAFSASLVAGGDNLYAVSERGDVYVFQAGDKFALVATNRLHEPCVATPAIAHNELYLRSQQHLYCIAEPHLAAADEPADIAPAVDPATIRSPGDLRPAALPAAADATLNATP